MTVKRKKSGKTKLMRSLQKQTQEALNEAALKLKKIARETVSRKYIRRRRDAKIAKLARLKREREAAAKAERKRIREEKKRNATT